VKYCWKNSLPACPS